MRRYLLLGGAIAVLTCVATTVQAEVVHYSSHKVAADNNLLRIAPREGGIYLPLSQYSYPVAFAQHVRGNSDQLAVEKGRSKSRAGVVYKMHQLPGPEGPRGATGATGPEASAIFATAYQSENVSISDETQIVLPFDMLGEANGISLEANTFTLPAGRYNMHFQFTIDHMTPDTPFTFTEMKLNFGDGSSTALNWSAAYNSRTELYENKWTAFSGALIFDVTEDGAQVSLVLSRTATDSFVFKDPLSLNNFPIRIEFHRI
jgi:hypothetical protein